MHSCLPLVSVVIPIYNTEKYVAEALKSVLQQTYTNIEILCVDDGGQDDSYDIVKRHDDPRIRVIRQTNRGLSGARNTGIAHARGEFVALLDADDFWHPQKIAAHVAHLRVNPRVGCSYSPSIFVDEQSNEVGLGQTPRLTDITRKHIFCRNPIGNGSAPVFRKAVLEQIAFYRNRRKMYFDEDLRQSEDIECWTRIALSTNWRFEGISSPYTYYRINMGGLSANLDKQLNSWKEAMKNLRKHHEAFFHRNYTLALAYQYRYLARRAIQARNKKVAITFTAKAIKTNILIVFEEPKRTLTTFACALLSLLPTALYDSLVSIAISLVALHSPLNTRKNTQ